jgi:hypothetical protein
MTLRLPEPREFTLAVRRPHWAGDGFRVRVNGQAIDQPPLATLRAGAAGGRNAPNEDTRRDASSFVALTRTWRSGDRVELDLPKSCGSSPRPITDRSPRSCGARWCSRATWVPGARAAPSPNGPPCRYL